MGYLNAISTAYIGHGGRHEKPEVYHQARTSDKSLFIVARRFSTLGHLRKAGLVEYCYSAQGVGSQGSVLNGQFVASMR